ncbi:MAG TPA: hypothetical protein VIC28_09590 [Thermoanaerobaculia bacterium]|jgi:hypothetical protein
MKVVSFDGDEATVRLKALEIRTLRNALREVLRKPGPSSGTLEERLGAEREQVAGLADTLSAVFDQVDPGDLDG